eukprot:COSAG02_NODE_683_length_18518_cov_4.033172_17_plen_96_part_00
MRLCSLTVAFLAESVEGRESRMLGRRDNTSGEGANKKSKTQPNTLSTRSPILRSCGPYLGCSNSSCACPRSDLQAYMDEHAIPYTDTIMLHAAIS